MTDAEILEALSPQHTVRGREIPPVFMFLAPDGDGTQITTENKRAAVIGLLACLVFAGEWRAKADRASVEHAETEFGAFVRAVDRAVVGPALVQIDPVVVEAFRLAHKAVSP